MQSVQAYPPAYSSTEGFANVSAATVRGNLLLIYASLCLKSFGHIFPHQTRQMVKGHTDAYDLN